MPQKSKPKASSGTDWNIPPKPDQIEVTLLGPGFGEAVLVHLGSNQWLVVDSCLHPDNSSAPLRYLSSLGVDAKQGVVLITATHWHGDHIAGLAELLKACPNAIFVCSSAMKSDELHAMAIAYSRQPAVANGTGVAEIQEVFKTLGASKQVARRATPSRKLLEIAAKQSAHGQPIEIFSLSPSDEEINLSLLNLTRAKSRNTKKRAVDRNPNHFSVALWISIGDVKILLGADLENVASPLSGWSAVLNEPTRPKGNAAIFKVPHHGSENGYDAKVWEELLAHEPHAVLTPWTLCGRILPQANGINLLTSHTPNVFMTAPVGTPKTEHLLHPAVRAELRDQKQRLKAAQPAMGGVRIRNGGSSDPHQWTVDLLPPAFQISS